MATVGEIMKMVSNRISFFNIFGLFDESEFHKLDSYLFRVTQDLQMEVLSSDISFTAAYVRDKAIRESKVVRTVNTKGAE